MSTYVAPVKDMLFNMNELAGLQEIAGLPGNEDVSADLVEAILDEAGKFASEVVDPLNKVGDKQGNKWDNGVVTTADGFKEAYASFCETGWNGMPASTEFGGQGLPVTVSTAVLEMWKSASISFSLCQMLTLGAVEAIAHHGSDALKATFLPNMVSGKWTGTMNLTEPQAGSDLAAIRSKAEPRGDGTYAITGTKIFITWGEHDMAENIIHLVLARLPDAPPGVKGISLFIAPKFLVNADGSLGERNDLICASIEHKMGIHGSATAVMSFGDKGGAIGYLVGEPNRGLEYMFTMMNHARLNVGLEGVGVSERSYQHALAYARDRIQGRIVGDKSGEKKPILHHPDVRRMLMDMKSRTEAGRALAYGLPVWAVQALMPLGFVILAVRLGARPPEGAGGAWIRWLRGAALATVGFLFARHFDGATLPLLPFVLWLLAALLAGAPIFAALGGLALALFWSEGQPLASVPLSHYQITVNPSLPALPLFTLAGLVFARSGAVARLGAPFTACFGGGYPTAVPQDSGKDRFECKISERKA